MSNGLQELQRVTDLINDSIELMCKLPDMEEITQTIDNLDRCVILLWELNGVIKLPFPNFYTFSTLIIRPIHVLIFPGKFCVPKISIKFF